MRPTYQLEMKEVEKQEIYSSGGNHRISNPYTSMNKYSPYVTYSNLSQHCQHRQKSEHYY